MLPNFIGLKSLVTMFNLGKKKSLLVFVVFFNS